MSPGRDTVQGKPLRATQTLVSHMAFCWSHPSLTLIEVAWRWLFGIPFLAVLWTHARDVLIRIPPASVGLDRLNYQNPWVSSVLLADAAAEYQPAVAAAVRTIVPIAVVVWAIVSGVGRMLVLWRMERLTDRLDSVEPRLTFNVWLRRLPMLIVLQGLWLLAMLSCFWLWYHSVAWAAAMHIGAAGEPDLVGYLCWLIFLSLGLFVLWAVVNWTLAIAPLLLFMEPNSSGTRVLMDSFRLGKSFSGKLVEVNLVMSIVKIALIVLAMVFSAAPLPFSDQFGPDFMHVLYVLIAVGFLIGNDYFQVVRLRSFIGLWREYRG